MCTSTEMWRDVCVRRETRRPGFPLWNNSPGSPTKAMRLPKSHVGACALCVQARVPSCQRWGRSFIRLMPLRLHLLLLTALSSDTFATSRNPTSALNPKKACNGLAGGLPGGAGPVCSGAGGPLPAGTHRGRQSGTSRTLGPESLSFRA